MTIKEMTVKTFPNKVVWEEHKINLFKREGFIVGAKTMLGEIEKTIKLGCDDIAFIEVLEDKIKELKG